MDMIILLRMFFLVVLASMLWVTTWASGQVALWKVPGEVMWHPWMIALWFDAYWGFLTFYVWVCYRERGWGGRIGWLIGILLLGNIAMAVYVLVILFRLPADAKMERILLRQPD
jgi:hypothetical protein